MTFAQSGRSLGLKLLLVGGIVLLLGVPLAFVSLLSWERSATAEDVVREVGAIAGGAQTVRGPFVVLPYDRTETVTRPVNGRNQTREEVVRRYVFISADRIAYDADQTVTLRHRAIYEVPVYAAEIAARGRFDLTSVAERLPDGAEPDWAAATVVIAISDLRGIARPMDMRLTGHGGTLDFEPGTPFDRDGWRGVRAGLPASMAGRAFDFDMALAITGASDLRFAASGRETELVLASDWPHPGFQGGFLPGARTVSEAGYEADWTVPYLARGVPAVFGADDTSRGILDQQAFGARLVSPADGYQQVARSLKYGLFFVALLMLLVFVTEARSGQRIHPAQYLMLGIAQIVFYLLLLALSEHAPGAAAYTLAMAATVALSGAYAMAAFSSRRLGVVIGVAMGVVYALQYVLILVEDYALLIGAVLAFAGLAATMLMTRRVDWYESLPVREPGGAA